MIPPNVPSWEPHLWREELARAYRSPAELLSDLGLPASDEPDIPFAMRVPRPFASKMQKGNPDDPLLRQVLPLSSELEQTPGFSHDPLQEKFATITSNLIQKYEGRALLITTPACAVHCRYCFRRHFPYDAHRPHTLNSALAQLAQDHSIREIILSGGDPLILTDDALAKLFEDINAMTYIKRLRIHTRLPIVLPQRISRQCLEMLSKPHAQVVIVVHCNHPQELDTDTRDALKALRKSGLTVLNQAVLLRGVNDHATIQAELSEQLFASGVLPYYLHLPDEIQGTAHFFVDEVTGRSIYTEMQAQLPGYLLPRLVKEVAGHTSKRLIATQSRSPLTDPPSPK